MKKKNSEPSTALSFLTIVMLLLFVAAIAFGIFSFNTENGLFAIASAGCLTSLLFGCISILK